MIISSFQFDVTFLYKEALLYIRTYSGKKILSSKFGKIRQKKRFLKIPFSGVFSNSRLRAHEAYIQVFPSLPIFYI
jgi:hypothetical protein